MPTSVYDNLLKIKERIEKVARKVGRDPEEITLVAVTKNVAIKKVREGIKGGIRVLGENYVQEAEEKREKIKLKTLKWHHIGHLQKNKAKLAAILYDMIHSVDSVGLAKELNKKAKDGIDVLIQVKLSDEKTKGGVSPDEAVELAEAIAGFSNLRLKGLMTIPPYNEDPERTRPYFTTLRRVAERINRERIPGVVLTELSMGMSADFEVAIEEGATMVRIGTALFGERKKEK